MIPVAQHHPPHPLTDRVLVSPIAGDRGQAAVRLDIGLVDDIEAEFVAQIQQARIVRVVRGAERVQVVAFHREHLLAQLRFRERLAVLRVVVVPVDAVDRHRAAVDQQPAIPDLDTAEAGQGGVSFEHRPIGVEQLGHDAVAGGALRAPRVDVQVVEVDRGFGPPVDVGVDDGVPRTEVAAPTDGRGRGTADAATCQRLQLDPQLRSRSTQDVCSHLQGAASGVRVEVPHHHEIVDAIGAPRLQLDGSMDPGMEPMILVLDPCGIAPADHHGRELVLALHQERRNVELRGETRVLAHSHEVPVAPHEEDGLGATDREHHLAASPGGGDLEGRPVEAGRVVVRYARRLHAAPGHLHVRVDRQVVLALAGPDTGHGDLAPGRIAVRRLIPP